MISESIGKLTIKFPKIYLGNVFSLQMINVWKANSIEVKPM